MKLRLCAMSIWQCSDVLFGWLAETDGFEEQIPA
jgi:hypothetical protein